ncbi:MAG: CmcJ/NvfI family oxidoreductase [Alteraurantiacibacter sp.]
MVEHASALTDFEDLDAVKRVHSGEITDLLTALTGCDHVAMAPIGILRFSERAGTNANYDNSHPARFVHVDMARDAAASARAQSAPEDRELIRSAQYNVWRVLSDPPQDVPLGLCDFTSIAHGDLLPCQAIFDPLNGSPEWGFPNYLLQYNQAHRWFY